MGDHTSAERGNRVEVPEVVIMRLLQYVRVLRSLLDNGTQMVSSEQLAELLQGTPAQIRKDLNYFGRFGNQGRGYRVRTLLVKLQEILGLSRHWNVCLVGVGRLGRAILSYPGFAPEGFQIVAAFDENPTIIGRKVGSLVVQPMSDIDNSVAGLNIEMGIVAVPRQHAQDVIDRLTECGIKAILNYAPTTAQAREGVKIRNIDPVLSLQSLTFYLLDHKPAD